MSDDRPNPFTDVRKGLGLLFRAARTAVARMPKGDLEETLVTSAREVGRAFENVASTLGSEILGKRPHRADPRADAPADPPKGGESGPGGSASAGDASRKGEEKTPGEPPSKAPGDH